MNIEYAANVEKLFLEIIIIISTVFRFFNFEKKIHSWGVTLKFCAGFTKAHQRFYL